MVVKRFLAACTVRIYMTNEIEIYISEGGLIYQVVPSGVLPCLCRKNRRNSVLEAVSSHGAVL